MAAIKIHFAIVQVSNPYCFLSSKTSMLNLIDFKTWYTCSHQYVLHDPYHLAGHWIKVSFNSVALMEISVLKTHLMSCDLDCDLWHTFENLNIVAAFPGMHVSPAKHSYAWLPKKVWLPDRRMPDKVILMSPLCFAGDTKNQLTDGTINSRFMI